MTTLNAVAASGEVVAYSGPVVRKWIHRGERGGDYGKIDVRDTRSGEMLTLTLWLNWALDLCKHA